MKKKKPKVVSYPGINNFFSKNYYLMAKDVTIMGPANCGKFARCSLRKRNETKYVDPILCKNLISTSSGAI